MNLRLEYSQVLRRKVRRFTEAFFLGAGLGLAGCTVEDDVSGGFTGVVAISSSASP